MDAQGITCGNHLGPVMVKHHTVEAVRACHLNPDLFNCSWLYERAPHEGEEIDFPGQLETECGGLAWSTPRGSICEFGHEYVSAEVRHREGWDYASDEGEAKLLRKYGTDAVAMNGTGI